MSLIHKTCRPVALVALIKSFSVEEDSTVWNHSAHKGAREVGESVEQQRATCATGQRRTVAVNDRGHVVGQDHHRAKLTDHDIWLIHELRAEGVKRHVIAEKMECSVYTVREVLAHRRRASTVTGQRRRT